jgi:HD-GYP domain-containing protein (c-di-GMP phosphodiesterase class II)
MMQLVPIETVRPGMRLARPVRRDDGVILLAQGVVLREPHLLSLKRLTIPLLYVTEEHVDVVVPEVVRQEIRGKAQQTVHRVLNSAALHNRMNPTEIMRIVGSILDDILSSKEAVLALMDARSIETELMQHSVGVTVLCILLGIRKGLSRPQLEELGVGALLHDVGKAMLPPSILYKPNRLTPEEQKNLEVHPGAGFEIVRNIRGLPLLAAHVAFQHHERLNGTGYPRRLKRTDIHHYATICSVADVFDAMTSPRPYREAFHPAVALHWIRSQQGLFDADVVRLLSQVVAPYPVATMVKLTSGEVGVVEGLSPEELERPLVMLVRDAQGEPLAEKQHVDLSKRPDLAIEGPAETKGLLTKQLKIT